MNLTLQATFNHKPDESDATVSREIDGPLLTVKLLQSRPSSEELAKIKGSKTRKRSLHVRPRLTSAKDRRG